VDASTSSTDLEKMQGGQPANEQLQGGQAANEEAQGGRASEPGSASGNPGSLTSPHPIHNPTVFTTPTPTLPYTLHPTLNPYPYPYPYPYPLQSRCVAL